MGGRKGRRDCRVQHRKKNNVNARVEGLQKAIRKAKKEGTAPPQEVGVDGADGEQSTITPSAAAFLASMRADCKQDVEETRSRILPKKKSDSS